MRTLLREAREQLASWDRAGTTIPADDEIREIREILASLVEAGERAAVHLGAGPDPKPRDPRRRLAAWSSMWWSTVIDSTPRALRRFGEVDPATAEMLAPIMEELADHLLRLKALAQPPPE